jgi:ribonuclease HIII
LLLDEIKIDHVYQCIASLAQCRIYDLATSDYKLITTAINPTILKTIVYGRAIITILMYERFISGAKDDVKRNKKAA